MIRQRTLFKLSLNLFLAELEERLDCSIRDSRIVKAAKAPNGVESARYADIDPVRSRDVPAGTLARFGD